MIEIEAKRKELKDKGEHTYLDGFNLGVEMARKEVIDIIRKEIDRRGGMANRIDAIRILELLGEKAE